MQNLMTFVEALHKQKYTKGEDEDKDMEVVSASHALVQVTVLSEMQQLKLANKIAGTISIIIFF
jgi:hypothetical protein